MSGINKGVDWHKLARSRAFWLGAALAVLITVFCVNSIRSMGGEMFSYLVVDFFSTGIFMATPLILTSIGAVFSERSGVVNIGLEG
ncbi:MAG TPA: hypothetical protein PK488_04955, partial [Bacillota bacterium]|nr:hypothetical protein [Bacillota bacterium]